MRDIKSALAVLSAMGAEHSDANGKTVVNAARLRTTVAPYQLVKTMRASVLALGPLLARAGEATVSLPGGCVIGARPVDMHIAGFEKMGAEIQIQNGNIVARAKRLRGANIKLPQPTVTGSENLMMAAALAEGITVLENAAREPEITDLAVFLNAMGADISGAGESTITIRGVDRLHSAKHFVMPDRIEAGTYLCAAAACGGDVFLENADLSHLSALAEKLRECGAEVLNCNDSGDDGDDGDDGDGDGDGNSENKKRGARITMHNRPRAVDAVTAPYPGYPTDLQAQWMAVNCVAEGCATITETVFENRFMHAPELARMGADIELRGNAARVRGVASLSGAPVMATDIRASAALVVAALAARGTSEIDRIYHLERGYATMEKKLRALGANAERK